MGMLFSSRSFSAMVAIFLSVSLLSWMTGVPQVSLAVAEQAWGYDFQSPLTAMWGVPLATLWGGFFWLVTLAYLDARRQVRRRPRRVAW